MAYQVLARKWRPKKFKDVVGQSHITRSLSNAIVRDRIGHAYLFTGTRGVGKTSAARIFAKAIECPHYDKENGDPCLRCDNCLQIEADQALDVIEIDGASHNGVDHIRPLVENIQLLPSSGRKRIYIIDEVHMLSKEAFNALLKTLESPPHHVIFMFATTVPEKILDTVLSRCQRFDFRNVSSTEIEEHLQAIAREEGIRVDSPLLLRQMAMEAKGSMRDALTLLDQVLSFTIENHITEQAVNESLGLARISAVRDLVAAILIGDTVGCSRIFRQVMGENTDLEKLILRLLDFLFYLIEHRQNWEGLPEQYRVEVSVLRQITPAELFWVYETLARDLQWSLKSIDPVKVTEIVLQKICARRELVSAPASASSTGSGSGSGPSATSHFNSNANFNAPSDPGISTGAATEPEPEPALEATPELEPLFEPASMLAPEPEPVPETESNISPIIKVEAEKEPIPPTPIERPWEEFLQFLFTVSPALGANVEQGNLWQPIQLKPDGLYVDLRFKEAEGVFLDYLKDHEVWARFQKLLGDFYSVPVEKIHLTAELLSSQLQETQNFRTVAEVDQQKKDEIQNQKKEELLAHPFIKMAQELFHGQIDRVIIN